MAPVRGGIPHPGCRRVRVAYGRKCPGGWLRPRYRRPPVRAWRRTIHGMRSLPGIAALGANGVQLFDCRGAFVCCDAEYLPFADASFDVVYSHGVLHHTPNTGEAIRQVHRVLRPGGRAIIMLYARESFTYLIGVQTYGRLRLEMARAYMGRSAFNRMAGLPPTHKGWIPQSVVLNNSTDGVGNPYSRVFSRREIAVLFAPFRHVHLEKHYFPRKQLPLIGPALPRKLMEWLGRLMGFFWYVKAIR